MDARERSSWGRNAFVARRATLGLLLLGVAACDSGSPAGPEPELPVAAVQIDRTSIDLDVGDTLRLQAVVRAANGAPLAGRAVTWTSGDATVAQVSSSGLVTGRKAGSTWVRASVGAVYGTTDVRILDPDSPPPVVSGLSPATVGAGSGGFTLTVTGTGFAEGSRVLWAGQARPTTRLGSTRLDASIHAADVAAAGSAEIRVEGPTGLSAAAIFTVTPGGGAPGAASLTPSSIPAGSEAFVLTVRGSGFGPAAEVRWRGAPRPTTRVSDTELRAEIGVSDVWLAGPSAVTVAEGPDGAESAPLTFTVDPSDVALVVVTPASLVLDPGDEAQLEVVLEDADGRPVTGRHVAFTSTDGTVVAAFGDGSVKALKFGTAKIRVATSDRFSLVTVVVNPPPVQSVLVEPWEPVALVGDQVQLRARTFAAGGVELTDRDVSWSSADPSIATVDAAGLVTARARGRVRIWAESEGQRGSTELEVRAWPTTPEWTFDLRFEAFSVHPTVGDTTWVDGGGTSHTAALVLVGATLVMGAGGSGPWTQELRLDLWEGPTRVGQVVREDRGTSVSGFPPGIFFSSTVTPGYTFTGTLGTLAELRLNQRIGTVSRPDWHYVIR